MKLENQIYLRNAEGFIKKNIWKVDNISVAHSSDWSKIDAW